MNTFYFWRLEIRSYESQDVTILWHESGFPGSLSHHHPDRDGPSPAPRSPDRQPRSVPGPASTGCPPPEPTAHPPGDQFSGRTRGAAGASGWAWTTTGH